MTEVKGSPKAVAEGTRPHSICILRLSAIGDVCNALAVVQEIQRQWPESKLTWIIGRSEFALLKNIHGIEFIIYDKQTGFKGLVALWRRLRKQRFDALLHMQTAFRASLVSLCIKAKRRIGFDSARTRELQTLFCNEHIAPFEKPHVLDGFIGFAHQLGLKDFEPKWEFPLEKEAQRWAHFITACKPFVLISPCASKAERNWSIEKYAHIADNLNERGYTVVLTTGNRSEETQVAKAIEKASTASLVNLAGSTNLQEVLALIKCASFVISPDSGPLHMSVMLGTPVIGLYAHSNPARTGPWHYREYCINHYTQHIEAQFNQNVDALPWGKRAKGKHLMEGISLQEVQEKIDALTVELKI